MGVVDEHKLSTNGPAAPCGCCAACRPVASEADLGVGVIEIFFPGPKKRPAVDRKSSRQNGGRALALQRDRGSPAVIGTHPLDRWLCVPVFRRVCPCHYKPPVS